MSAAKVVHHALGTSTEFSTRVMTEMVTCVFGCSFAEGNSHQCGKPHTRDVMLRHKFGSSTHCRHVQDFRDARTVLLCHVTGHLQRACVYELS